MYLIQNGLDTSLIVDPIFSFV